MSGPLGGRDSLGDSTRTLVMFDEDGDLADDEEGGWDQERAHMPAAVRAPGRSRRSRSGGGDGGKEGDIPAGPLVVVEVVLVSVSVVTVVAVAVVALVEVRLVSVCVVTEVVVDTVVVDVVGQPPSPGWQSLGPRQARP